MLQRQVVNLDGTRRYRCPVQSKFAVTRPPPIFRLLHQPLPHGIQRFQQAMPSPSREEPTGRTARIVATRCDRIQADEFALNRRRRQMVTFLYWNTNRKPLHTEIRALAEAHEVDVIILSEFAGSPATLIERLNSGRLKDFQFAPGECERIQIFTRFSSSFLRPKYEDDWISIRQLKLPARMEILLVAAHLPSKRYWSEDSQALQCPELARTIMEQEENVGHQSTLLVGDLNMNPFEKGMASANGMNAVMSRQVASRKSRTVMSRPYPFFFNPMWAHFGDRQERPPGTYYYERSDLVNYYWNVFDQVMVRPELMDRFDGRRVRIPTKIGETSLLFEDGRPNKRDFSDPATPHNSPNW